MVESRRRSDDLAEAGKNDFSRERFFVSAEDQIKIIEAEGDVSWRVNVVRCLPLTVGVSEYTNDQITKIGKSKNLVPNASYRVGGKSIFIMTPARIGDGQRVLKMIGPKGTKFEKI